MKCDRFIGTGISPGSKTIKSTSVRSISGLPHVSGNCHTDTVDISSQQQSFDNKIESNTKSGKVCPLDVDILIEIKIHPKKHTKIEHNSTEIGNHISIRENRVYILLN